MLTLIIRQYPESTYKKTLLSSVKNTWKDIDLGVICKIRLGEDTLFINKH